MTPEEKGYHVFNENSKQFQTDGKTLDQIGVFMFIAGCEFGKCEIIKEHKLSLPKTIKR